MSQDEDQVDLLLSEQARLADHRLGGVRKDQLVTHMGEGDGRGVLRDHADDTDLEAAGLDDDRGPQIGPLGQRLGRSIQEVRGEDRKRGLGETLLQGAKGIPSSLSTRAYWPIVKLVVPERGGRIPQGVEGEYGIPLAP